jgi:hypothetical protein
MEELMTLFKEHMANLSHISSSEEALELIDTVEMISKELKIRVEEFTKINNDKLSEYNKEMITKIKSDAKANYQT